MTILPPELLTELESVAASGRDHLIHATTLATLLLCYRDSETNVAVGEILALDAQLVRVQSERDAAKSQLAEAQRACAEMRQCLKFLSEECDWAAGESRVGPAVYKALSSDCGKDYVHRSELDAVKARLENTQRAAVDYRRCLESECAKVRMLRAAIEQSNRALSKCVDIDTENRLGWAFKNNVEVLSKTT